VAPKLVLSHVVRLQELIQGKHSNDRQKPAVLLTHCIPGETPRDGFSPRYATRAGERDEIFLGDAADAA
jgi:hypothetical protein